MRILELYVGVRHAHFTLADVTTPCLLTCVLILSRDNNIIILSLSSSMDLLREEKMTQFFQNTLFLDSPILDASEREATEAF